MKNLTDIREKLINTKDSLGKQVDKGIFDTVLYLNYLGLNTVASCEGHLDHGLAAPWIDIEDKKSILLANEIRNLHKENKNINHSRIVELSKKARNYNLALIEKLLALLNGFYSQYKTSEDSRLIITHLGFGIRLTNQGSFLEQARNTKEKDKYLKNYQEEMKAFTKYLESIAK